MKLDKRTSELYYVHMHVINNRGSSVRKKAATALAECKALVFEKTICKEEATL